MISVRAQARPGHPWIFSNEIIDPPVLKLPPGAAVEVSDAKGRRIGCGYANPRSLITIRLLGFDADPDDPAIYRDRLAAALRLRQQLFPDRPSGRLCAGEADGLPGLIIDRYVSPDDSPAGRQDVLSIQVTTLGMEQRLPLIEAAIREVLQPTGVLLRNDLSLRELEGLPLEKRVWWGEVPVPALLTENGATFEVDLIDGQKTGFFFDQAENRAWMIPRARGATALDLYSYVGAWAVEAARAGATEVVAVDASALACSYVGRNAARNGVAVRTVTGDAREVMEAMIQKKDQFDLVFHDPPAFAKSRKTAAAALVGYRNSNALALRLVRPGGLLFTSSCSHHIQADRFLETILEAAHKAGRRVRLVRRGGQAPDHPILPGVPETEYLKHLVFAVD